MRAIAAWNLLVFAAWIIVPFALAGPGWLSGWLYLGCVVAATLAESIYVSRVNPALKARRKNIGAGTKTWDLWWNALFWPLMASVDVVAAVQYREQEHALSVAFALAGLIVVAAGFTVSAWAMGSNPFFEGTVRIQTEAAHTVFEGGPYRYVRHPGYAGLILWALGTPLMLRSTWAFVAAGAAAAWIALRTALEDATLRRELPGYEGFTARTKHRLLPGIW